MVIEKFTNQVDAVRGRRNPDLEYPQSTQGSVPSIGVEDRGHEFYDYVVKLDGRAWRRGSERPNYGRGRACCPESFGT